MLSYNEKQSSEKGTVLVTEFNARIGFKWSCSIIYLQWLQKLRNIPHKIETNRYHKQPIPLLGSDFSLKCLDRVKNTQA